MSTWTTGHKKVLIIPVRFTDQAGPSDTPGPGGYLSGWSYVTNGTTTAALSNFFASQSYGKCTLEFTVLPEIDLGVSYTAYNTLYSNTPYSKFTSWYEAGSFADDVRARARVVGQGTSDAARYDTDNYDLDIIACGFIPGQGTVASGYIHGKGIFGTTFKALAHELCHNFGLQHGNGFSRATFHSPIKNGTFFFDTYGDVYDLMGFKDTAPIPLPPDRDANVYWKNLMGWLPDEQILTPAISGTYRIHAFDQGTIEPGNFYALRIPRDPSHTYWFSFRQAITNTEAIWSDNGLEVRFGGESMTASSGHTTLIDTTPGSRGLSGSVYATMYDAPLAIGRTYTDPEAALHVTPIKKGGTTPESLDVVLNYGPFPGNASPVVVISPATVSLVSGQLQSFTATASDPDGDTLAYHWEFDDPDAPGGASSGGAHPDSRLATQGAHAWTRKGEHLVRCTVTDMKGHSSSASAKVTITTGAVAYLTISGVVKDENGNPLSGAVVNNYKPVAPNAVAYGATNFAGSSETAADGGYTVVLPANGANKTYLLTVMHQGYSFSCSVAGGAIPVAAANVANVNFTRLRANRTISGAVVVAGRAYDPLVDGPLLVTVGAQSVNATLGSWQMTVPDGTLAAIGATPANSEFAVFTYFTNPYRIVNDFNLLHIDVKIPNRMPAVGFSASSATSDDSVGTIYIPVTMTLPQGSNSWVADQSVEYWIDGSGTAEYGIDYKMSGGRFTFYNNTTPGPRLIPLKIIPGGIPKKRTIVIKLGPASSIANLGQITTFTYTIDNSFQIATISQADNVVNLTWPTTPAAQYTIQATTSLTPPAWTNVPSQVNFSGDPGSTTRTLSPGNAAKVFYRIKVGQ